MATWHQARARKRDKTPLDHASKWSVVTDPPSGMSSTMLFPDELSADVYLFRLKGVGKDRFSFKLPPRNRK